MSTFGEPQQSGSQDVTLRVPSAPQWTTRCGFLVRGLPPAPQTCGSELVLGVLITVLDQFECWDETWTQVQWAELSVLQETGKGTS